MGCPGLHPQSDSRVVLGHHRPVPVRAGWKIVLTGAHTGPDKPGLASPLAAPFDLPPGVDA